MNIANKSAESYTSKQLVAVDGNKILYSQIHLKANQSKISGLQLVEQKLICNVYHWMPSTILWLVFFLFKGSALRLILDFKDILCKRRLNT